MDLEATVRAHPELVAGILAASSGPLGELLVARELGRRGCQVEVRNDNGKQRDLWVIPPGGEPFFVETKTVRVKKRTRDDRVPSVTWIVNAEPDPERSKFWVLVVTVREPTTLPRDEDVIYYVLTAEEAARAWKGNSLRTIGDITTARLRRHCPGCEGDRGFRKMGV